MSTEVVTAQQKMLSAMIDAAAVGDPAIKARLTVAAVWQYMQLPDSCFGWIPREKPGEGAPPPLPVQCKALCVITTLSLGLTPGQGHVLWLGTKCYIDIYGKRVLAARTPGFALLGRRMRKLEAWEREIFGLKDGDMALAIEQDYRRGNDLATGTGYGILDINQIGSKPGTQNRKDAAMSLITRAERDFYNRFFPVDGLADMPENPREFVESLEMTALPSADATTIKQVNAEAAVINARSVQDEELELAAQEFAGVLARVRDHGGDATHILGMPAAELTARDDMLAAADVLEDWLKSLPPGDKDPDPSPPKGKPGRKSKAAQPELALKVDLGGQVTPPTAEQANAAAAAVEANVSPAALEPKPAVPPAAPKSAVIGELVNANKPTPFQLGKAQARLRQSIDRVAKLGGAPMHVTGYNPFNTLDGGNPLAMDATSDVLDKWQPGQLTTVEKHELAKTQPPAGMMDVPPPSDEFDNAGRRAPANRTEAKAIAKEEAKPAVAAALAPVTTPPNPGAGPAYQMLERSLAMNDIPPTIKGLIAELATRNLLPQDHLYLPKFIRLAKAGNSHDLEDMLSKRAKRL